MSSTVVNPLAASVHDSERRLSERVQAMTAAAARVTRALAVPVVPVSALLTNIYTLYNNRFTFNGDVVPVSYVMGTTGMLPCVAWGAQDAGHRLLGADLACSLRRDERALFGLRAVVPPVTGNLADIIRGLFFMHAARMLFGLRRDAEIEVSQVYEMFEHEFKDILAQAVFGDSGEIAWPQPSRPR